MAENNAEMKMTAFHYEPEIRLVKEGMQRVAAYCRVSTLQDEQALSFETQCTYYENLLNNTANYCLVGIYGDHGLSGLKASSRPEFQRLIRDCLDGKIDRVFVKSVSRFSRNTRECLEYIRRLKQKGVVVYFEKECMATDDERLEMILGVYSSIAQNDSCSLSANIRWTIENRAAQGDPVQRPSYGYRHKPRVPGKPFEWIINEDEAERVRLAFSMADAGQRYCEIVAALNAMENEKGTDAEWNRARVRRLLVNEVYKGDILTNKSYSTDYLSRRQIKNKGQRPQYYIEEHHTPIIEPRVFDRVGKIVMARILCDNTKANERAERYARIRKEESNG